MPLRESVSLDQALYLLNEIVALDPKAAEALVETRVVCNKALADHPTIQVGLGIEEDGDSFQVGILGLLNGMFGADDEGYGQIAAWYNVVCPNDDHGEHDLPVGKPCPTCETPLILGSFVKFGRMDEKVI
jgi:hypothetical protein